MGGSQFTKTVTGRSCLLLLVKPRRRLERRLDAELHQAAAEDLRWAEEGGAVVGVDRQHRTRVERIVDVELRFDTGGAYAERPRETEVDLTNPVFVGGGRRDERHLHRGVGTSRQGPAERRR